MITESDLKGIRKSLSLHVGGLRGAYRQVCLEKKVSEGYVESIMLGRREIISPISRKVFEKCAQLADDLIRNQKRINDRIKSKV